MKNYLVRLVAEVELYERWKHLQEHSTNKWRSGIKHDCAKVMEFTQEGNLYRNGEGELVELEEQFLFPMLKSSDVANSRAVIPRRWMLVTQKSVGDDTSFIKDAAPKTWHYLQAPSICWINAAAQFTKTDLNFRFLVWVTTRSHLGK